MGTMACSFKIIVVLLFCCWQAVLVYPQSVLFPASSGLKESNIEYQPYSRTPTVGWRHLESRIDQYVASAIDRMGAQITSNSLDGASSIPSILSDFPTAEDLGLLKGSDDEVDESVHVLHIPSFGNWSSGGWELRFRGTVYKQQNVSGRVLRRLARVFGLGSFIEDLGPPEKAHLCKMLRGLFMVKQRDVNLTFQLEPPSEEESPDFGSDMSILPRAVDFLVDAPSPTNLEGDYDFVVPLSDAWDDETLLSGQSTDLIQVLGVSTNRTDAGHPLAYLVPSSGHTVVSDIDDVLRVSTIFQPKEGLQNLLTRPFYPWMNMREVYSRWALLPDMHFHYLTTSPTQMAESYMDFVFNNYPAGSFDGRMINITDIPATLSIRQFLLEKVLQTFPNRKFTLVGDSSNYDIMEDYPKLALKYPDVVQCILIRNTSATDHGHWLPHNTKWFRDLDESSYMFFRVPDDLIDLDISNGECYNTSVPQHLTFGWQGFPASS